MTKGLVEVEKFGCQCSNPCHIARQSKAPSCCFSFFMKCQSGDIKCYSGAPNFNIHLHIGYKISH